jgi:hypothetical protein
MHVNVLRRSDVVAVKVVDLPIPSEEFEPGELIGAVNGEPMPDVSALRTVLDKLKPADLEVVRIQRGLKPALLGFELP